MQQTATIDRHAAGFARIQRHRSARGFTLLELLIALSLSLLLLAAVYGALNLYWRLQSVGQADVEQAQLQRAIIRQLELDVASVIFYEPEEEEEAAAEDESMSIEEESTAGSGSSSDSSDTSDSGTDSEETTVVEDAASAYVSTSMGIVGDSQTLVLHISRPTRDLSYAALSSIDSVGSHVSDARSVSYFLAAPGGTGLAGAVQPAAGFDAVNNSVFTAESGLARLEGDRMAIEFADLALDTETLGAAAQIIAPEVVSLEFQYFDGAAWQTSWDSTAYGQLPQAIEVSLGIVDRVAAQQSRTQFDAPVPVKVLRHVIAVPLAGPYVPESY
jgi:prepilin-type N-terminal cleavage/methylation domain-containing protein